MQLKNIFVCTITLKNLAPVTWPCGCIRGSKCILKITSLLKQQRATAMRTFFCLVVVFTLAFAAPQPGDDIPPAVQEAMGRLGPVLLGLKIKSVFKMAMPENEEEEAQMEGLKKQMDAKLCEEVKCAMCVGEDSEMKAAAMTAMEECKALLGMEGKSKGELVRITVDLFFTLRRLC